MHYVLKLYDEHNALMRHEDRKKASHKFTGIVRQGPFVTPNYSLHIPELDVACLLSKEGKDALDRHERVRVQFAGRAISAEIIG